MKTKRKLSAKQARLISTLTERLLHQVDVVGYELSTRNITQKVNRHNLAALMLTSQNRLQGEWARLQLHIGQEKLKAYEKSQAFLLQMKDQITHPDKTVKALAEVIHNHPLNLLRLLKR